MVLPKYRIKSEQSSFAHSLFVRILFYRDGISDGNFSIADDEIAMIREATEEALGANLSISKSTLVNDFIFHGHQPKPFLLILPPAYVIAQSKVGLRMVPSETTFVTTYNNKQRPVNNVPPGTALKISENSFYLVAQSGLKGTSKPVKYIVHQNENVNLYNGSYGLTMENLMNCTNSMCGMYPSATKVCFLKGLQNVSFLVCH